MPMPLMLTCRETSRCTKQELGKVKFDWMTRLELNQLLKIILFQLRGDAMQIKMPWRKLELFWNKLIGIDVNLSKTWLTPMRLCLIRHVRIKPSVEQRPNVNR